MTTRVLVVDVETTGLLSRYDRNHERLDAYPHVLEIAWIVFTQDTWNVVGGEHAYLNTKQKVTSRITRYTGITSALLQKKGQDRKAVVERFFADVRKVDVWVAHNAVFERIVLWAEATRLHIDPSPLDTVPSFCTMHVASSLLRLPQHAMPPMYALRDLHRRLLSPPNTKDDDDDTKKQHNARDDVLQTLDCYLVLSSPSSYSSS